MTKNKFLKLTAVFITAIMLCATMFALVACKHEHTFSESWSYDEVQHWHEATCEHSDEVSDKADHDFDENNICTVCDAKGPYYVDNSWEQSPTAEQDSKLYRDYYHIFVFGFADSNGDGIGDLKGVEQKLDYIADLGFNGIWLSPIFVGGNNDHKYDVINYYDIDPIFGTLEDFQSLVEAAHAKDINIMLDMVINHTSNQNPWFVQSQKAWKNKDTSNPYYGYYTFLSDDGSKYSTFEGVTNMPKLNLSNEGVKEEIDKICKYWLQDYGVDAFRLDAAKHFFGTASRNVEFMQWLMATARQYNPDVYMVGEVWTGDSVIYSHYAENSVQSFFNFAWTGAGGSNQLMKLLNQGQENRASRAAEEIANKEQGTAKGIDALFVSNHDTSRFSNYYSYTSSTGDEEMSVRRMENHRMSVAFLYTQAGNVFNYYGNEIGLRNGIRKSNSSDYVDHTYRIAMNWDSLEHSKTSPFFAYKAYGYNTVYGYHDDKLGGVAQQIDDQSSMYNFYRRVMLLRRQNPEIARGTSTYIATEDSDVLVLLRTYNGSSVLLVYNLSYESNKQVDLSKIISDNGLQGQLAGFVSANYNMGVRLVGTTLNLPHFSIAVIR